MKLSKNVLSLFLEMAHDTKNWKDNEILVGGNVKITKPRRHHLELLKIEKLLVTFHDKGYLWAKFTEAGKALALSKGIEI